MGLSLDSYDIDIDIYIYILNRPNISQIGTMPLIEKASKFKDENMKMACCMALYNLKLSFVHLKAHKEVQISKMSCK